MPPPARRQQPVSVAATACVRMGETALTFRWERRPRDMRVIKTLILACAGATLLWPQAAELKTTQTVLEKYQRALGGADAIRKVQSETRHGEVEGNGIQGKATFIAVRRAVQNAQ